MPHVTRIARKPKSVGFEFKEAVHAETRIVTCLEIQEGIEVMDAKKYMAKYRKS